MNHELFLPGVSAKRVLASLSAAGGKEIESGKFANPESSAALACNAFGWFIERPSDFPSLPGLDDLNWPATDVAVERCLRFPWSGGRHPWLDAVIETPTHLIGVESKRFEPFRDTKSVNLSAAYDRAVWGETMKPFEAMRDELRSGTVCYAHLDAAQLVKHAFGLITQGGKLRKSPVLYYLFAEPAERAGNAIPKAMLARHRAEIADFTKRTSGSGVRFGASSYREWLALFDGAAKSHADAIIKRFAP